jgi:hypothetical protein
LGAFVRKNKVEPSLIPAFVEAGLSDEEIADRMGWTVGTLRVRCSQLKISLRRKIVATRQVVVPQHIFIRLQHRAAMMGISASELAAELLEMIARDSLYDAVLDRDDEADMTCAKSIAYG